MPSLETPAARWQEILSRRAEARRRLDRHRRRALQGALALVLLTGLLGGWGARSLARPTAAPIAEAPAPDRPPHWAPPPATRSAPCPIPARLRPLLERTASRERVPIDLLAAVAQTESHWRPRALSPAGAQGLMQLMPQTARSLGVDPGDPAANVQGGARYLRGLLERFHSTRLALAAYNAGPTLVARVGVPDYGETTAYVTTVLSRSRRFHGCRG